MSGRFHASSLATVAANSVAGQPDPVATALHAAAPVMLPGHDRGRPSLPCYARLGERRAHCGKSIPLVDAARESGSAASVCRTE
jgi:hypothetical protein